MSAPGWLQRHPALTLLLLPVIAFVLAFFIGFEALCRLAGYDYSEE